MTTITIEPCNIGWTVQTNKGLFIETSFSGVIEILRRFITDYRECSSKIEAVKLYRQNNDCGLKESKEWIEANIPASHWNGAES